MSRPIAITRPMLERLVRAMVHEEERLCSDGHYDPAEQQACAALACQLKQLQGDAFLLSAAGSPQPGESSLPSLLPELEATDHMTLIYGSHMRSGQTSH